MSTKDTTHTPHEALIRIFINGEFFSSLLCTPKDIKELAIGWLFNQGYIESIQEIGSMGACEDMQDISINLTNNHYREMGREQTIRTSACMGGEISYRQFFRDRPTMDMTPTVTHTALKSLMKKTLSMAHSYRETGGIHCASLASATDEKVLVCFEDIGRHNAVDKVTGRMLLQQIRPDDTLLLTSGRISSEMVVKAAHSRIPVVASITTATDLALRIAEDAGLTIVGRVLAPSPMVWCGKERIIA